MNNRDNNYTAFYTNNAERLRIANTGALGLSGANYGTSGQVLTSQGSGSAPQWATPAGGKILQVVQGSSDSVVSGSGSTWVANPATVSITTSSASSKVLLLFHSSAWGTSLNEMGYRFKRGSTAIGVATTGTYDMKATQLNAVQYSAGWVINPVSMNFLDSPGAVGTYSYSVEGQIQGPTGGGLFRWNATTDTTGSDSAKCLSVLIAMEVQN